MIINGSNNNNNKNNRCPDAPGVVRPGSSAAKTEGPPVAPVVRFDRTARLRQDEAAGAKSGRSDPKQLRSGGATCLTLLARRRCSSKVSSDIARDREVMSLARC